MIEVNLFVEDAGHEAFLTALLARLAGEYRLPVHVNPRSVTGGHGRVMTELGKYVRALAAGIERMPDLLVVAIDANCRGFSERRREIDEVLGKYRDWAVCAVPDPHIERWMLLDSSAFSSVLGMGCAPPDQKCNRDRYKQILANAVRAAGVEPILGGLEYADEIAYAMDLQRAGQSDRSFHHFMEALRDAFSRFKMTPSGWQAPNWSG
jgi:hypothetical protein